MDTSSRDKLSLSLSLILASAVPAFTLFAVPSWIRILSIGQDVLPPQTRFLFANYRWSLLYPIVVLALWLLSSKYANRRYLVPTFALFGAIVLLAAIWWAGTDQDTILEAIGRTSEAKWGHR